MNPSPVDVLFEGAGKIGFHLTSRQIKLFGLYLQELSLWGKKINLYRRASEREIIIKDFLDSMTPAKFLGISNSLLDLGSGAGFPGVPLKIIRDDLAVVLMEKSQKKYFFLKDLIRRLGLHEITVDWTAEKSKQAQRRAFSFDCVISRAFGPLIRFAAEGLPYLKENGILLAMKGRKGEEELEKGKGELGEKGLGVAFIERIRLPLIGHERLLIGLKRA